ncbi:MAG: GNAT family N-acetyltransferase [Lachnospiraceae bacterium]|nr:GNAT family N-acetyltransferase [Lachnospiraceae bacterium]
MKYLITVFKDHSYPYLDRVLADVMMTGTTLVPVTVTGDAEPSEGTVTYGLLPLEPAIFHEALSNGNPEHSFILTDCDRGVSLAGSYRIGYCFCDIRPDEGDAEPDIRLHYDEGNAPRCVIQGFDEIDADFIIKMYERSRHLPWTILKTDRLILREMTVADVDRLYEIYEGDGITKYMEPLYEDRAREVEYTKDYIRNMYEFCGYGLWLVIEKDTCRIVGRAGVTGREGYDDAELGYVIEKDRQGIGYATEACSAIIGYARDVLGMKSLNCFVQPGNDISVRLCERLGFKYNEDVCLNGEDFLRYIRGL